MCVFFKLTKRDYIVIYQLSIGLSTALLISIFGPNAEASSFKDADFQDAVARSRAKWGAISSGLRAQRLGVQEEAPITTANEVSADSNPGPDEADEDVRRAQVAADAEMARGFVGGDVEAVRRAQREEDEAVAWRLHTEGLGAGAGAAAVDDDRPDMPGDVALSYTAYDQDVHDNVGPYMDVHAFNAATNLKVRLPVLLGADIFSDHTMKFAQTRASIEASAFFADFEPKVTLGTNMDALGAHLAGNPVEAGETGANIEEIFSRVWSLARNRPGFARQVFVALCNNTETGGGCYQGHAGRLARLYVNFLRSEWKE